MSDTAQPSLFGDPTLETPKLPQSIRTMWRTYGKHPTKHCRACPHLKHKTYHDQHYLKCEMYGDTNGPGTDWPGKWNACGLIDNPNQQIKFGIGQETHDD